MSPEPDVNTAQLRIQGELVNALERCECLRSDRARQMLADLLSDLFGEPVFLQGSAGRMQLLDLVRQCLKQNNGLFALTEAVHALDPQAPEIPELTALYDELTAVRALPTPDWEELRQALRSVRLDEDQAAERRRLRKLAWTATRGRLDDLPAHCDSVWTTFVYLADHNAGPDSLPPAMLFVACLADHLEDKALEEKLLRWNWRWAERFEVTELVERAEWREQEAVADRPERVYLMFEVDPDPVDQHKIVLSWWRQWAVPGWNARRRGDVPIRLAELEGEIDLVIAGLETELGRSADGVRAGSIFVEFALPWELINTPVEQWRKASMSTQKVPLLVDHEVVLRSLERMRMQRFLFAWKQRWNVLAGPAVPGGPYWSHTNGGEDFTRIAVDLKEDDTIVSLVLSEPPDDRRGRAWHEAAMAFRAGIPIIVWDREDCTNQRFQDAVAAVFAGGPVAQLPQRVSQLRRAALKAEAEPHAGRSLAVLWDDADRLPEPLTSWWGFAGRI